MARCPRCVVFPWQSPADCHRLRLRPRRAPRTWNLGLEFLAAGEQRRQPPDLQLRPCSEDLDPLRWQRGKVDLVAAPVRPTAVVIRESVITCELPRAPQHAGAIEDP